MITKKLLMAGALAVALSALTGCGDGIDTGTVTKKEFNPAYTVPRQQCMGYNPQNPAICMYYTTVYDSYPERYRLYLKEGDKNGWVDVSPDEYKNYTVGGHYPDAR